MLSNIAEFFSPGQPLKLMSVIVIGILIVATVLERIFSLLFPRLDLSEIRLRVKSWWVMAGVFLVTIAVSDSFSLVMMALLCYLALKEYFTLLPTSMVDRGSMFWSYLAIPVQFYWIYLGWYDMFIIFIPVWVFLFIPFVQILGGETKKFVSRTASIQWGVMLFVFGLGHMALLAYSGAPDDLTPGIELPAGVGGRSMLLFLVFLTEMNDVMQFCFGKAFGRRKIAPSISPKKTWAGFLGGLVLTSSGALPLRFCIPWVTWWQAMLLGAMIAMAGFIGDLVVSALKRDFGVKDSGFTIPGHGGVLDRVDSLCYTAPVFLHTVLYFWYK